MTILDLLIVICLGVISGIITGLIPGVHINLVASLILINFVHLNTFFDLNSIIVYIITMSIIHTFIDFIPSIVFGVPNADTALSLLPAHQLVLSGEGFKAIFLSSLGSLFGAFFIVIVSPLFYFGLETVYDFVKSFIPYILIFATTYLIIQEKNNNLRFWALVITGLSGTFGLFILNSYLINNVLLILFTGLFGVAGTIYSFCEEGKIPRQNFNIEKKLEKNMIKSVTVAGFASSVCCVSPGLGNAQAGNIASMFYKKMETENFIFILSAINTINFVLSIITLYTISRARNGAILAVSQITEIITFNQLVFFSILSIVISIIGFFLTLKIGKISLKLLTSINIRILNLIILIFLIIIVGFCDGIYGLIVLAASTSIGLLVAYIGVRRVHLMTVLLIPVVFNLI